MPENPGAFCQRARWFSKDTINILMAHVFTLGCIKDGSEQSLSLGNSYLPSYGDFSGRGRLCGAWPCASATEGCGKSGQDPIQRISSPLPAPGNYGGKGMSSGDFAPGQKPETEDLYFDNPKPIEKWVCGDYQAALEKCMENQDRPCYVYLHIHTDSFIREEQIKELKNTKKIFWKWFLFFLPGTGRKRRETFWKRVFRSFYRILCGEKRRRTGGGTFGDSHRDHRKGEGI